MWNIYSRSFRPCLVGGNPQGQFVYTQVQVYSIENRILNCAGSCEPGSRCRPNKCIFGCEEPRGVGILGLGVYGQGEGNVEFSLQATGDQGGRILSQLGGFPSK